MILSLPKGLEAEWLDPTTTESQLRELVNYVTTSEEFNYHTRQSIRSTNPIPRAELK